MTMMAAFVMLASTSVHTVANTGSAGNVIKLADGRTVSPGGELTLEELKTATFVVGGNQSVWIAIIGAPYAYYMKDDPEPNWAYEAQLNPGDEYSLSYYAKWFEPDYVEHWGDLAKNTHLTVETCDDYRAAHPTYNEYVFRIQNGIESSDSQKKDDSSKPEQTPSRGQVKHEEKTEPANTEKIDTTQKTTKVTKAKSTKTSITLTWKKQKKGITGYEIQCSTDKTFTKDVKTVTVNKAKTNSKVIKKLWPGRKYYVRIRTFKKNGNEKVYSSWSKLKAVRTKVKIYMLK
jgi:hypothetical protein